VYKERSPAEADEGGFIPMKGDPGKTQEDIDAQTRKEDGIEDPGMDAAGIWGCHQ
jgi:hypothetical protein